MNNNMKKIGLIELFNILQYDWSKDREDFRNICYYTKSRVNNYRKSADFDFGYGMEQPFALKAIAEKLERKNFFEIGTGRGTGSYAVATAECIDKISTIDIVPFKHKRNEAIGYDAAFVSNYDLREMLQTPGKDKINFYERQQYPEIMKQKPKEGYDLFFIDGNHTDFSVISEDFLMCKLLSNDDPIIIWDDFYPDKFAIKDVVMTVLNQHPEFKAFLLSTRGHLFEDKQPEKNSGMVVMLKEEAYENIFSKG